MDRISENMTTSSDGKTFRSVGLVGMGSLGSALFEEFVRILVNKTNTYANSVEKTTAKPLEMSSAFQIIAFTTKSEHQIRALSRSGLDKEIIANIRFCDVSELETELDLPDWLFVTVPDQVISEVAHRLSKNRQADWSRTSIIHCSGALSSQVFTKISNKGAQTASFHPLQTFPKALDLSTLKGDLRYRFQDVPCSVEGDPNLSDSLLEFFSSECNAKPFLVNSAQKTTLHLAAVFISNGVVPLLSSAKEILQDAGVEDGLSRLGPLFDATFKNVTNLGEEALSGPLKRGDVDTIRLHIDQLKKQPAHLYRYALAGLLIYAVLSNDVQQSSDHRKIRDLLTEILNATNE